MDPAETERTYKIRKQQTRFYWVWTWELMEHATILTPPSTGLKAVFALCMNQILLKDQNMKKYQHLIDVRGEVLPTPRGTSTAVTTFK